MTTTALLALGVTGLLAAAAGLFTWVVADLAWDVQRALRDAGRRWRGLDLVAWLRAMEVGSAAPDELAEAELYGLVGVPWRGLMALSAAGGVLLLLPLALELNSWPLAGLGLLAGLAPEVVRRLRIREAQAAILNQVRDLLLALRLRLVLQVSLTAALREIASTPAEVERLGILGQRLQHHVTSAAYDLAPEDLLERLARDLRSPELHTLNRRARGVRRGARTYADALQDSMGEVTRAINTRHEQEIESAPGRLIIFSGAVFFFLLLLLFGVPVMARALAAIAVMPGGGGLY